MTMPHLPVTPITPISAITSAQAPASIHAHAPAAPCPDGMPALRAATPAPPATLDTAAVAAASVQDSIRARLENYFHDLDGQTPSGMYNMLLQLVEKPLLETVMQRAGHNQSRAAQWLGLNRNTLRKKLLDHHML